MKVIVQKGFAVNHRDKFVRAGGTVDLPKDEAERLIKAGKVKAADAKTAPAELAAKEG